jgi:FMN phosphatase YigB (HAD superfamily)
MGTGAILFDLDDTLIVEEQSAHEAFLAACMLAQRAYGLDPGALAASVRRHAGELWRGAGECLMVGDSLARDAVGARRAGLRAIWLNRGGRQAAPPARGGNDDAPEAEISSLSQLIG